MLCVGSVMVLLPCKNYFLLFQNYKNYLICSQKFDYYASSNYTSWRFANLTAPSQLLFPTLKILASYKVSEHFQLSSDLKAKSSFLKNR